MRVLHVLDHSVPLHSGYSFRTLSILKEQRRLGWQTEQLTSPKQYGTQADVEEVDGFTFYRTRVPAGGWRSLPLADQVAVILDTEHRLNELIGSLRPDLVHAHSPCLNGIAALRAGRRSALPVVYEMRASWEDAAVDHGSTRYGSPRYRLSRALETWVLRRADAVTTICEGLRKDILSRGIPNERVSVIPNGVNLEEFPVIRGADAALKRQLGLEGAPVLGFLGSFYGYEGLDVLVAALPRILQAVDDARVLLVGGGREEQAIAKQAAALGVADKLVMVGRVPHADVARYYSVVDMLVYPRRSIRLTETVTPLKPLEAMAQGRLVVASDVGGHRELIDDGRTGFLFTADDPSALASCVVRIVQRQAEWPEIIERARRFVETERTWTASVARYAAVYEQALRQAKAR